MLGLFISNAYAQAAPAQQNPVMSLIPLALVFVVFYFFMIKPQKKKMEEEQKFLSEIQKGDEVFTKSGMIGTIVGLTDKIVTLELEGNVKVKFLRSSIGGSMKNALVEKTEEKKA